MENRKRCWTVKGDLGSMPHNRKPGGSGQFCQSPVLMRSLGPGKLVFVRTMTHLAAEYVD